MRYLGGKSRLARKIVEAMHPERFPFVWEPFCGGFAVTSELGRAAPDSTILASDVHPGLIALGSMLSRGIVFSELGRALTDEEYRQVRGLPDSNAYKALVGFGCSFGGKWFAGNARAAGRSFHDESIRNLVGLAPSLAGVGFARADFLQELPDQARGLVIYCDPPYYGTEGYGATKPFDHGLFWARCTQWARNGAKVFVSEFSHPDSVVVREVLFFDREISVNASGRKTKRDTLYEVLP